MLEETPAKKYSALELRKSHPRMGMKWSVDEDTRLKKSYLDFRSIEGGNFESFLAELVTVFGRATGGLKARLAMHFTDVPGWDYEAEAERSAWKKEAKTKDQAEILAHFGADNTVALLDEYEKYVQAKQETFRKFSLRMAERFQKSRKNICFILSRHRDPLVEYMKGDLELPKRKFYKEETVHIDFSQNRQAEEALRIMEQTQKNLFLTGEAGTGKSTLLQYFRQTTKKNVVVLAPTGVAALNVGGQTIHSFCAFGPDITPQKVKRLGSWAPKKKLLASLQTIIIDEISMVRADLLDCVDKFLRMNCPLSTYPFGGVQMVFIGDLYQLPPVEKDFSSGDGLLKKYPSPYFFDSEVFRTTNFAHVKLQHIYRQQDRVFIDVLNAVRNNAITEEHLSILNQRALSEEEEKFTFEQFAIYLTPTNARARQVNNFFLERIATPLLTYVGHATGTFEDRELPTDLHLQIKIGSQVMMLNNDRRKRWVNGTMGKIVGVSKYRAGNTESDDFVSTHQKEEVSYEEDLSHVSVISHKTYSRYIAEDESISQPDQSTSNADSIIVELETGETVYVDPYTWEMFKFVLDKDTKSIDSESTGSFTQYPFKLAWAVTIHKAQGKTFNKVYIDLATGTFAHGQLYVALSRCRTLQGLFLRRPVVAEDIILDDRIVKFVEAIKR